jgi:hypothetical protein
MPSHRKGSVVAGDHDLGVAAWPPHTQQGENTVKKKALMGVAPLFAVAAFAVAPAVAQAEPHWYANAVKIVEAEAVPVTVAGVINLKTKEEGKPEYTVKCKVAGKTTVVNPTGGGAGTDEFSEYTLSACAVSKKVSPCPIGIKLTVTASALPWAAKLTPGAGKLILDSIASVGMEYKCGETLLHTFTGTFTPRVTTSAKTGGGALAFGLGAGELTSGTSKILPTGAQLLTGPTGKEKITVHNP